MHCRVFYKHFLFGLFYSQRLSFSWYLGLMSRYKYFDWPLTKVSTNLSWLLISKQDCSKSTLKRKKTELNISSIYKREDWIKKQFNIGFLLSPFYCLNLVPLKNPDWNIFHTNKNLLDRQVTFILTYFQITEYCTKNVTWTGNKADSTDETYNFHIKWDILWANF